MTREIAWNLLRHGYDALVRTRTAAGAEEGWFEARMLGRRALVVGGEEGVRTFYDPTLVERRGAVPAPLRLLLFGRGAVHGLDGEQHRRRKKLFPDVVDRTATERLGAEVSVRLEQRVLGWDGRSRVRLHDELVEVYGAAVLAWAGRTFRRRSFLVLDVQGTNTDPAHWARPDGFDPARFVGYRPGMFAYVPQGGGDPAEGHRCPGEPLAVGILEVTVRELARTSYRVAGASRQVPRRRAPSLPSGGVELVDVRRSPWLELVPGTGPA